MSLALLMISQWVSSAAAVDMYVSSTGNNTIYRLKDDGSYTVFNNTIASPTGVAFGNGKFFVNSGGSKIVTLTWTGAVTDFITTGILNPSGLAYGGDGFLYIADSGSNSILRSDDAGNLTTFATGLSNPRGLTFDNQGNLYVTNGVTAGSISRITPAGVRTTLTSGLNSPYGISFGSNNLLYVTTTGDGGVSEVTLAGAATLKGS
ncbi:MAG: SMP-30/gluconolactonase/LRE family protein, partial [Isosphaeraceae bacterium]